MTTLPFFTLVRIAWRSLFIQAGFSPDAMQTLGLLYALAPAWPHLYPTPEAQAAAARQSRPAGMRTQRASGRRSQFRKRPMRAGSRFWS